MLRFVRNCKAEAKLVSILYYNRAIKFFSSVLKKVNSKCPGTSTEFS
ncbi:hypothetical protein HMPREF1139_1121 [Campylobacter sp. FOBRC14]|nr:hypothetical protein HMPREF1139_1121 [Campylobacter sp. FOBRC14]